MSDRVKLVSFSEIRFKDNGIDIFIDDRKWSVVNLAVGTAMHAKDEKKWEIYGPDTGKGEAKTERFADLRNAIKRIAEIADVEYEVVLFQ